MSPWFNKYVIKLKKYTLKLVDDVYFCAKGRGDRDLRHVLILGEFSQVQTRPGAGADGSVAC